MISIPSFIISFTVIRSQLYFANSPATIFSEPALCRLHTIPRPCVTFHIKLIFYGELSAPCPTPNLEDQPLLAVCNCLFHIFTFTLCIWRPSPQSATQRQAILWQQGSTQHRQLSDCLDKKQCMSYEPLCSSNQRKLYKRQIAKLLLMSWWSSWLLFSSSRNSLLLWCTNVPHHHHKGPPLNSGMLTLSFSYCTPSYVMVHHKNISRFRQMYFLHKTNLLIN